MFRRLFCWRKPVASPDGGRQFALDGVWGIRIPETGLFVPSRILSVRLSPHDRDRLSKLGFRYLRSETVRHNTHHQTCQYPPENMLEDSIHAADIVTGIWFHKPKLSHAQQIESRRLSINPLSPRRGSESWYVLWIITMSYTRVILRPVGWSSPSCALFVDSHIP